MKERLSCVTSDNVDFVDMVQAELRYREIKNEYGDGAACSYWRGVESYFKRQDYGGYQIEALNYEAEQVVNGFEKDLKLLGVL